MNTPFCIETIRQDFPLLHQEHHGKPLLYLDNAATSQKPKAVLDTSREYYEQYNSNIHRGTHYLSQLATERYELARRTIAEYLGVTPEETLFTSGTTASINTVAHLLTLAGHLSKGDRILISGLEHHSNIVPWQMAAERVGAELRVIPVREDGTLDQEQYRLELTESVKIVSITQISNAFGTVNPVKQMIAEAREMGAITVIDGAQSAPHGALDLRDLDCDFFAFSGHKVYGPTGIGVLYGKRELLESLPPFLGGGEMIQEVSFERSTYNVLPYKYEAGTPNIEGAIALGAALQYLTQYAKSDLNQHEQLLINNASYGLEEIPGIILYGPRDRISSLSFNIAGIHHFDMGTLLDQMGIAVRTGHHCCQPLMKRFGVTGTVRASFAFYNNQQEVERFLVGVNKAISLLS